MEAQCKYELCLPAVYLPLILGDSLSFFNECIINVVSERGFSAEVNRFWVSYMTPESEFRERTGKNFLSHSAGIDSVTSFPSSLQPTHKPSAFVNVVSGALSSYFKFKPTAYRKRLVRAGIHEECTTNAMLRGFSMILMQKCRGYVKLMGRSDVCLDQGA